MITHWATGRHWAVHSLHYQSSDLDILSVELTRKRSLVAQAFEEFFQTDLGRSLRRCKPHAIRTDRGNSIKLT